MIDKSQLGVLRRFFPVTTGKQTVHTLLRLPDAIAFCDNWNAPQVAAVTWRDDLVLAGDAQARGWTEFIASLNFSGFVQAPETFLTGLRRVEPKLIIWRRISFVLNSALKEIHCPQNAEVRKVAPNDAAALEKIGQPWVWKYWLDAADFCRTGTAYVAVMDGEAVSVASIFTESDHYVDPAVATHPEYLRKGLAIAAVWALCKEIISTGKIPVWNTSPENIASCTIPRKLGFKEIPTEPLYVMKRDVPQVV